MKNEDIMQYRSRRVRRNNKVEFPAEARQFRRTYRAYVHTRTHTRTHDRPPMMTCIELHVHNNNSPAVREHFIRAEKLQRDNTSRIV